MFDNSDFPKPLDEDLFDQWMEEGRNSKIANYYLLIIWDEMDEDYTCEYISHRQALGAPAFSLSSGDSRS